MVRKLYEERGVILVWVIANFLGVAIVGLLPLVLPFLISVRGMLVGSLIVGLPIGIAQWIALRRVAPISILWGLTISVGLFLGLMVINRLIPTANSGFLDDESVLLLTTDVTIIGLLVGLVQWLFLRGHFTRSSVWLLSSAGGFGLGAGLVLVTNLINESGLISLILAVLVYTIVTGLVITWLPTLHAKAESSPVNVT
jgi:hypothetical protein